MLDSMAFFVNIHISARRIKLTLHNYFEFIMFKAIPIRGIL
jgi:hypothetical protein